jgi:Uma2 family endonuclease
VGGMKSDGTIARRKMSASKLARSDLGMPTGTIEPRVHRATPAHHISYAHFLHSEFGEGSRVEWVDGKVVHLAPISDEHSDLNLFLITLMRAFVDSRRLGAVRAEPFNMKIAKSKGRSPDVMFIANENLHRLKKTALFGPADLAVEIVSGRRRRMDRVEKYGEYEKGGVREYWVLDQRLRLAEFFSLGPKRKYQPIPVADDGAFHSPVLTGLWLRPQWLWEAPLPSTSSVLRQWGVV